jgi:serine/threonine protein kinase
MATGRQAFVGNTSAVVFHGILAQTPVSPISLNPTLPAELERIINKALEKDRDLRCQTAAELRADLKRLKRDTDSGRSAGVRSAAVSAAVAGASRSRTEQPSREQDARATAGETPAPRRRWPLWLAGLLAVTLVAVATTWFLLHRPPRPSAELAQKRLTFNSSENLVLGSAISPDGQYLAYSDPAGIHVKLLSTGDARLIPRPAGVPTSAWWVVASWFPDGTQLLADAVEPGTHGSIWTVSVLGNPHASSARAQWVLRSRRMGHTSPSPQIPDPRVIPAKSGC